MAEHLLEVSGLSVDFHTAAGVVHAVRGVSFHVDRGETLLDRIRSAGATPFGLHRTQRFQIIAHRSTLGAALCERRFVLIRHRSFRTSLGSHAGEHRATTARADTDESMRRAGTSRRRP